jgi:hypothetical protein
MRRTIAIDIIVFFARQDKFGIRECVHRASVIEMGMSQQHPADFLYRDVQTTQTRADFVIISDVETILGIPIRALNQREIIFVSELGRLSHVDYDDTFGVFDDPDIDGNLDKFVIQ